MIGIELKRSGIFPLQEKGPVRKVDSEISLRFFLLRRRKNARCKDAKAHCSGARALHCGADGQACVLFAHFSEDLGEPVQNEVFL